MENIENVKSGTNTQTTVSESNSTNETEKKGYEGDLKDLIENGENTICAPLFLMFAEYLGYVGKTLPFVDKWCVEKVKPESYMVKFIEVEAFTVFNEAKKTYGIEKIKELYKSLYEIILFIYDDNLKEMKKSGLPF